MKDDYIELNDPNEVIREGDELKIKNSDTDWAPCESCVGDSIGEDRHFAFRRPRSTVIRDAAIELLRKVYAERDEEYMHEEYPALRKALGLTIEELRGDA